jgi:predicted HTH domain antitoxin
VKWTENEESIAVAAYRNGDCSLNECSRVYGVPEAAIRRHAMKQI